MAVFIIGAGVGDTKYLTGAALEKIEISDVIIGAKRVVEPFSEGKRVFFEYDAERIAKIIGDTKAQNTTVLFSGDVTFYSGAKKLVEMFPEAEVFPGISSMSYFMAKVGKSCNGLNIASIHGRKCNIVSEVRRNRRTFALLGENPCANLVKYGLGTVKVWIGERLSYEDERVLCGSAEDFRDTKISPLSVIYIENNDADDRVRIGIEDEEFIRGNVPMTKAAMRAVTMAKLEIKPDDICCDVGAGTGSVSVEMALAAHKGTVYAVEKNPEAAELIKRNAVKFMADNIEVISGSAPDALDGLPKIDKLFIGGSSGTLKEIIEKCKCGHVVVNAVALETLSGTLKAFDELGYDYEIMQISASYARRVGGYNMMTAQNPVFVITGRKGTLKCGG